MFIFATNIYIYIYIVLGIFDIPKKKKEDISTILLNIF